MYKYQKIVKIYKRFKRYFDFLKVKTIITIIIKDYEVYIKTKTLQYKLYKELQILFIFEWVWSSIIINFIVKLFKSKDPVNNISYNSIFVIVKHFIKYSKFILLNKSYLIEDLADIIVWKIINNYRLLDEFVINKGITFTLRFFIIFIIKLRINNKFFIVFYL